MDTQWLSNKKRFLDKIDMMDASFAHLNNIPPKYGFFISKQMNLLRN